MWTEDLLNSQLTIPSQKLVDDMKKIEGDILILGAGGKMGPSLALLAKNAIVASNSSKRVIGVSRFTDSMVIKLMKEYQIDTINMDLLEPGALNSLPDALNIIYMVGRKFGTDGQEAQTWAMNTWLPSLIAERYKHSRLVVYSTGNVYPMVPVYSGGATEKTPPAPIGEYGMSCLGRERMFEYGAEKYGTQAFIYRLNYAVDLRYGVLHDIAASLMEGKAINISTPCFNCIWQGDANEMALRALLHTGSPAVKMNITGPETVSVRHAAQELGRILEKAPIFEGEESGYAYLNNAGLAMETFGYPSLPLSTLIRWQAEWILDGGRSLSKPTHFEERKGKY
jgi:dTDP-4-dehydrorhamnose reductase